MILGALIALGVEKGAFIEQIKLLDIFDFEIIFKTVDKSGISAIQAEVKVPHEHAHRHLHTIQKIINDSRLSDNVKARAIEIFTKPLPTCIFEHKKFSILSISKPMHAPTTSIIASIAPTS